jgi:hypothetical protein
MEALLWMEACISKHSLDGALFKMIDIKLDQVVTEWRQTNPTEGCALPRKLGGPRIQKDNLLGVFG